MTGYLLALTSVLCCTAAQLLLRWAMLLHPGALTLDDLLLLNAYSASLLLSGISIYVCSLICWVMALRYLPLNRLYPLLSLSYVLVWLLSMSIPLFNETFHMGALAGVVLILSGLLCMNTTRPV